MIKEQMVIIGFDGSKYSDKAIDYVINHFDRKTSIELIYVEESITPIYLSSPSLFVDTDIIKRIKESADKKLKIKTDYIKKKGFKANYLYKEGSAADEIIKESKKSNASIIIIGSRGMGRWKGSILGSVSQALAIRSTTPVLIVK